MWYVIIATDVHVMWLLSVPTTGRFQGTEGGCLGCYKFDSWRLCSTGCYSNCLVQFDHVIAL